MSLSVISVHSCSGEDGSSIIGSQFPLFDGTPLVRALSSGGGSSIIGMTAGGKDSGGTGIVALVKLLSSGAGKASLALLQWHQSSNLIFEILLWHRQYSVHVWVTRDYAKMIVHRNHDFDFDLCVVLVILFLACYHETEPIFSYLPKILNFIFLAAELLRRSA